MRLSPIPRILVIFPHPDDESFLCGGTIAKYAHSGRADVFLYTLTRGESSRNARILGITPGELAALRSREVAAAADILGVREFVQGDYPDGGLRDYDPRILETDFERMMRRFEPHVVVTFDVQGGSVHPDHIIAHHVVKRVFVTLRESQPSLRRLCFSALPHERTVHWPRRVFGFPPERIHAVIDVSEYSAIERAAVHAHVSVRRDVEEHNYDEWMFWNEEYFSFFQETLSPPVDDLFAGLEFPDGR